MSDSLDQIQASLEATAAICGSNARAIQANGEQVAALSNRVDAFIEKVDTEGLRVTIVTEVVDEVSGDVAYLEREQNRQDASIEALRQDAIADRQAFREQAEADRQEFREALEADRKKVEADRAIWQQSFNNQLAEIRAQGEQIRALLSALATTNRRVDDLEQAS